MSVTRSLLYGSIFSLIYFSLLLIMAWGLVETPWSFSIIGELVTIPLLLFVIGSLIFSGYKVIKEETSRSLQFVFGICLLILGMLILATLQ